MDTHKKQPKNIQWNLSGPITMLGSVLIIWVASNFIPEKIRAHAVVHHAPKVAFFVALLWFFDRVIRSLFRHEAATSKLSETTRSLLLLIARIILYSLGLLLILDNLGVSLTPLLASLGVSSIAVALALQDTLANFFSGIYMLVDQPVRPGDTIQIDTGYQGKVLHIGWRSTHITLGSGNTLVIPNTKLASALITNFDLPSSECNIVCSFALNHLTNLDAAEKAIQRAMGNAARSCADSLTGAAPTMNFSAVTDRGIAVNVTFKAVNITEQGKIIHSFIKNLSQELIQDKIEFGVAPR